MRFEGDRHRFRILLPGTLGDVSENGLMGAVDAVEITDTDDRGTEGGWDVIEFVEDLHEDQKLTAENAKVAQRSLRGP